MILMTVVLMLISPSARSEEDAEGPGCGKERWAVKVGTDFDVMSLIQSSVYPVTIAQMRTWAPMPRSLLTDFFQDRRIRPIENHLYSVDGILTEAKLEDDSDYHLVLIDAEARSIIAEIPKPECVTSSEIERSTLSPFKAAIATTRKIFESTIHTKKSGLFPVLRHVRITGPAFFDFIHGQTGVAPNGIEIHPVLSLEFLDN